MNVLGYYVIVPRRYRGYNPLDLFVLSYNVLYILRTEAEVSPQLGSAHVHISAQGFFVGARGMCRLLGTSASRSGTQAVASCQCHLLVLGGATAAWSLLQCYGEVAYPRSGDLVWLASMSGASPFTTRSFYGSLPELKYILLLYRGCMEENLTVEPGDTAWT
ncbi:hypothetical protein BHM03_00009338 [Ensete ventricosum]|uniref:Uncharacterized protein n=1 Tax=Ensete ventricosum TaxID=4639 RepID=A0A445MCL4_ENSVE|nr:hypothetical protein BHM03_00009338 [Ensete ventricosum]